MASGAEGHGPSPLVDFLAGTAAGIASLLAGHPFDTIKTRLQAQAQGPQVASVSVPPSAASPLLATAERQSHGIAGVVSGPLPPAVRRYTSAFDALRRIVAEERFMGLYKGVTSPMLGVALSNACIFGSYGMALRLLEAQNGLPDDAGNRSTRASPALTSIFLAGCASGVVSALVTAPIDLVKIRQQLSFQVSSCEPSTWSVVRDIWRRGGLRGMYRGLGSTCVRDLGYGPYFCCYEVLNRMLLAAKGGGGGGGGSSSSASQLTNIDLAVSGGLAGVVAWLSTFPADVVKTRVQAIENGPRGLSGSLRGRWASSAFLAAARATHAEGGWRAFFAGVGPTVVRAIPVNAAMFITFEAAKEALTGAGL